MSDTSDSTLSDPSSALNNLLTDGLPPLRSMPETEIRRRAEELAMAVAYTWLNRDSEAQEAFLSEIVALGEDGVGVLFAIDVFTRVRLSGVRCGMLRPGVEITTRWTPPRPAAGSSGW